MPKESSNTESFSRGKNYDIKKLPTEIEIFSIKYDISYYKNPSEVDADKRKSLLGETDFWNRTIRIYCQDRTLEDVFTTLLHEILHLIDGEMEMGLFENTGQEEERINRLAVSLFDTFYRNNWLKFPA